MRFLTSSIIALTAVLCSGSALLAAPPETRRPWEDARLSAEERARLLDSAMTQDERFILINGSLGVAWKGDPKPDGAVGSGGYVPGIPRLGIPALQEVDAGMGIGNPLNARPGDQSTVLPSNLATAATWNLDMARVGAGMVAGEARAKGFNVLLAGGVNLAREPRAGRNFEGFGEDPLLVGKMAGTVIRTAQDQGVLTTIKHFAYNDSELGRNFYNVVVDPASARESDLLAFEIGMSDGQPGSVMCAYNRVDTLWSCQHPGLLTDILRKDWGYKGWVMSDWGAVKSPLDALAGLDQESGSQLDKDFMFDKPLRKAVAEGKVPATRISEMTRRILYGMFSAGLFDKQGGGQTIDRAANAALSRQVAEQAIVLLRNERNILPLAAGAANIAIIGGRANAGVLQGSGSSVVIPYGGPAAEVSGDGENEMVRRSLVYIPSSPMKAIKAHAPRASVEYVAGDYTSEAVAAARKADVAIVFVQQWTTESFDVADLSLPNGQDQLVEAVAAANPNTIVVIESGGAIKMPWFDRVGAVVEAWYPGSAGGEAIADVLFGKVNPSGRLPITFPASEADLPRPELPGAGLASDAMFDIRFDEGAAVGYRWFDRKGIKPFLPFGYGLSYTSFGYDALSLKGGKTVTARFTLRNEGKLKGQETAQLYGIVKGADGTSGIRLLGWQKVELAPGESRSVSITADPRLLAAFDAKCACWSVAAGPIEVRVGRSATDFPLSGKVSLTAAKLPSRVDGVPVRK